MSLLSLQGLYPESHGIIDNKMYDMDIGEQFRVGSAQQNNPQWWGGEPVSTHMGGAGSQ